MIIRPGQIPGYPPAGMRMARRKPIYPQDGASFAAITGQTLTSLYVMDEASGNLDDKITTNDLTVANTPTFATDFGGRRGVYYDGANDRHAADVLAVGTTSMLAFVVCKKIGALSTAGIMGRSNVTFAEAWFIYTNAGDDKIFADIRGAGASQTSITSDLASPIATQLTFIGYQMDRTANLARLYIAAPGVAPQNKTADITGFGSFDGATQLHALGAYPGLNASMAIFYHGIRINADAEGASKLPDIAKALGWAK